LDFHFLSEDAAYWNLNYCSILLSFFAVVVVVVVVDDAAVVAV